MALLCSRADQPIPLALPSEGNPHTHQHRPHFSSAGEKAPLSRAQHPPSRGQLEEPRLSWKSSRLSTPPRPARSARLLGARHPLSRRSASPAAARELRSHGAALHSPPLQPGASCPFMLSAERPEQSTWLAGRLAGAPAGCTTRVPAPRAGGGPALASRAGAGREAAAAARTHPNLQPGESRASGDPQQTPCPALGFVPGNTQAVPRQQLARAGGAERLSLWGTRRARGRRRHWLVGSPGLHRRERAREPQPASPLAGAHSACSQTTIRLRAPPAGKHLPGLPPLALRRLSPRAEEPRSARRPRPRRLRRNSAGTAPRARLAST